MYGLVEINMLGQQFCMLVLILSVKHKIIILNTVQMKNALKKHRQSIVSRALKLQLAPDPEAINFMNPRSNKIRLGALKTQIDRRLIKILTMLGDSCNVRSERDPVIKTETDAIHLFQLQEGQKQISFDTNRKSQNSKVISLFEPNDLQEGQSDIGSNESLTKRTIEEMSIYKIFGFKNSSNCEEMDLDNVFAIDQNQKISPQTLNINIASLQNITNKRWNRPSNTDRDYQKPSFNEQKNGFGKSRDQDKREKQNNSKEPSVCKRLFSDEKSNGVDSCKISIKNILEQNGRESSKRYSFANSPLKRVQHSRSYMLTSRSSAKRTNYGRSVKRECFHRSPVAKVETIERMRDFVNSLNEKKMRKQSVDSNVRLNMLKRILSKHPQIIKQVACS